MKELVATIRKNPKLQKAFNEHIKKSNAKIKKGTGEIGKQLNKVVMDIFVSFAKANKIKMKDSKQDQAYCKQLCKQIGAQLDEMIVKQFKIMTVTQTKGKRK